MSRRIYMGVFEREEDILGATRAVRDRAWKIADIYAPYAVHGLDRVAGFAPSRLPWICFALAVVGAAFKIWFEYWTTAVSWPINVSGKPWNSLPAFVPVTFEVMVLVAGVGTVIAFLIAVGLRPGRKAVLPHPRVTDDRFALLVEEADAAFDPNEAAALFARFNAVQTLEYEMEAR
jgi:hypothetical protein